MIKFPRWQYVVLFATLLLACIYALPNIFGESPVVQVSGMRGVVLDTEKVNSIVEKLANHNIKSTSHELHDGTLSIHFANVPLQLQARQFINSYLDKDYSVSLNLLPITPNWLVSLGATPMKLGLDLRGGVKFLMAVDLSFVTQKSLESDYTDLRNMLRTNKIQYEKLAINNINSDWCIELKLRNVQQKNKIINLIQHQLPNLVVSTEANFSSDNEVLINNKAAVLILRPHWQAKLNVHNEIMEQTVSILRNRINELGVAESVVQRQGKNQVIVELPGIQDTAKAKDILGKTATLDFVMEDEKADIHKAVNGIVPFGSRVLYTKTGVPVVVKKQVILSGNSIVAANSAFDQRDSKPVVSIKLGGSGLSVFKKVTADNVGKLLVVVYRESYIEEGNPVTKETIISRAEIMSGLGSSFQISGVGLAEARDLASLLRAGAMPTTLSIIQEQIIGPSLGAENIAMGIKSVIVGLSLVLLFMTLYYNIFGIIANLALGINLVFLIAIMSIINATLTLPGIAGIVLTLGMAVDANVLIFERIREELRSGKSSKASIQLGFEHAFTTILDSNLTTLIVGLILFSVGSGPVKGFAVTLSIGILTSMFTAITGTKALLTLFCNRTSYANTLPVGIS